MPSLMALTITLAPNTLHPSGRPSSHRRSPDTRRTAGSKRRVDCSSSLSLNHLASPGPSPYSAPLVPLPGSSPQNFCARPVPETSCLVPYFVLISALKLYGTYIGLIVTYTVFALTL